MRKFQIILTSLLLMLCGSGVASAQGFLKGLADKAKDKVKQKIEQKVENTVDDAADRVLNGKKSKKNNSEATETQEVEEAAAPSVTTSNVKSDFVPGSVVVFEDVVKGEQVGEFPSKWDLDAAMPR